MWKRACRDRCLTFQVINSGNVRIVNRKVVIDSPADIPVSVSASVILVKQYTLESVPLNTLIKKTGSRVMVFDCLYTLTKIHIHLYSHQVNRNSGRRIMFFPLTYDFCHLSLIFIQSNDDFLFFLFPLTSILFFPSFFLCRLSIHFLILFSCHNSIGLLGSWCVVRDSVHTCGLWVQTTKLSSTCDHKVQLLSTCDHKVKICKEYVNTCKNIKILWFHFFFYKTIYELVGLGLKFSHLGCWYRLEFLHPLGDPTMSTIIF